MKTYITNGDIQNYETEENCYLVILVEVRVLYHQITSSYRDGEVYLNITLVRAEANLLS